jgi:hypothetical protein
MAPAADDFKDGPSERRYKRNNLSWRIAGKHYTDSSRQDLLGMVPGRGGCILIPLLPNPTPLVYSSRVTPYTFFRCRTTPPMLVIGCCALSSVTPFGGYCVPAMLFSFVILNLHQ